MKQFIYLDTDIVTSIIAQEEKGIITQISAEAGIEKNQLNTKEAGIGIEGKGVTRFWKFLQAEASMNVSGKIGTEKGMSASTKGIIDKILHDATFDIAYDYINPLKAEYGDKEIGEEGQYLELKRVFDYVDLDYLNNLFEEGGVIDLIKSQTAESITNEINNAAQGLNRNQQRNSTNSLNKETKRVIAENNKQYEDAHEVIKALKNMIPYSRMLISHDGFLIPLDDQHFRIMPSSLGFKYGGMMTCVGMVTNIIGVDTDPCDSKNIFGTIQFYANEVLRRILPTPNENICVIHPIAIYYG